MPASPPGDAGGYAVEWTATALRQIERLPAKAGAAVIVFVYGALATSPRQVGKTLHFELEGSLSARRGPYRVVYLVDDSRHTMVIEAVGHRSDVYRRR